MTGSPASPDAPSKPAWWVWLAIGGVLVVVTLVIVLVAVRLPSGNTAAESPTPTTSATPSDPAEPSGEPTPAPSVTASPVPIDEPATIEPGLTAQLDQFEAVQGEARGPGEVSGPAIRFRVSISNSTSAAVDLRGTVVTVTYGSDRIPALQLYQPGAVTLPTSVAPGETATAVYIFTIPLDERGLVGITVDYAVGVSPLEFIGPVPSS